MRLLSKNSGFLFHPSRRNLLNSRRFCGVSMRQVISSPKLFQTCSFEFISGEHTGNSIISFLPLKENHGPDVPLNCSPLSHNYSNCCIIRDYNRYADRIPILRTDELRIMRRSMHPLRIYYYKQSLLNIQISYFLTSKFFFLVLGT